MKTNKNKTIYKFHNHLYNNKTHNSKNSNNTCNKLYLDIVSNSQHSL